MTAWQRPRRQRRAANAARLRTRASADVGRAQGAQRRAADLPRGLQRPPQAGARPAAPPRRLRPARRADRLGATPRHWPSPRSCSDGVPIRLTGQDADPRHLQPAPPDLLRRADRRSRSPRSSTQADSAPRSTCHNSPLSENAALGFEYGYSVQAPDALVLWEGQYGDFINGAQVIVDEFVVSGQAKWGLVSGLVAAAAARLGGPGPRSLERSPGALPASSPPRTTSASPTAPRPRSTTSCCAARRPAWARDARGRWSS